MTHRLDSMQRLENALCARSAWNSFSVSFTATIDPSSTWKQGFVVGIAWVPAHSGVEPFRVKAAVD